MYIFFVGVNCDENISIHLKDSIESGANICLAFFPFMGPGTARMASGAISNPQVALPRQDDMITFTALLGQLFISIPIRSGTDRSLLKP